MSKMVNMDLSFILSKFDVTGDILKRFVWKQSSILHFVYLFVIFVKVLKELGFFSYYKIIYEQNEMVNIL